MGKNISREVMCANFDFYNAGNGTLGGYSLLMRPLSVSEVLRIVRLNAFKFANSEDSRAARCQILHCPTMVRKMAFICHLEPDFYNP